MVEAVNGHQQKERTASTLKRAHISLQDDNVLLKPVTVKPCQPQNMSSVSHTKVADPDVASISNSSIMSEKQKALDAFTAKQNAKKSKRTWLIESTYTALTVV